MQTIGRCSGIAQYGWRRRKDKTLARHSRSTASHSGRPFRRVTVRQLLHVLIEEIGSNMLCLFEIIDVLAKRRPAAMLISIDRIIQGGRKQCFPGGTSRTECLGDEDRQQDKERERSPKRQKNLQEETFHEFLALSPTFSRGASRGRAKMYPTPRMVLMCSSASVSPSFLRTLLTCISMLRSNGENLRLSTAFTRRSRGTTRPASRSKTSKRLNSTDVRSTGCPSRRTRRVAGSSSISPTRTISGAAGTALSPRVRRNMARMRATSSRGLNGLGKSRRRQSQARRYDPHLRREPSKEAPEASKWRGCGAKPQNH